MDVWSWVDVLQQLDKNEAPSPRDRRLRGQVLAYLIGRTEELPGGYVSAHVACGKRTVELWVAPHYPERIREPT